MKTIVIYIMLFIMLLYGFSCSENIQETHRKQALTELKFDKKIIDFGKLTADTLLTATYKLFNTGTQPLIIDYVNPDCICTAYELTKDTIQPGDSAFINLHLDTHDKYGDVKLYTTVCANTKAKFYKLTMKLKVE